MMKSKKRTSKIMSVLSAVIAIALLSTTVFASGALADLAADDYTVEILNNGEKIELINKPFIENGEVYVPLRETMEKAGFNEANSRIAWNDSKIQIAIIQGNGTAGLYGIEIGKTVLNLRHIRPEEVNTAAFGGELYFSIDTYAPPVLKDFVTYVSVRDMDYMLYKFLEMRFSDNSFYELTYQVCDKNGNVILDDAQVILKSPYENSTPQYAVDQFFKNIELSQYEQAGRYCSDEIARCYHYDTIFSPQKIISEITVDYTKDDLNQISAEFYTEYTDNTTPAGEQRKGDNKFVHWKAYLTEQADGRYLIYGWESITDVKVDEDGNLIKSFGGSLINR